jgi:hypothetical protein
VKQHYLPKFYLTHFTAHDTPDGQDPYLWAFRVREWKKKAPKNLATISDFYSFKNLDGSSNHTFEELFYKLESNFAPVLARIALSPPQVLSDEDKEWLALFLVSMRQRVPTSIDSFAEGIAEVYKKVHWLQFQQFKENPLLFEKAKDDLTRKGIHTSGMTIDDLHPDKYKVDVPNAYVISAYLGKLPELASHVASMNWTLLVAKDPSFVSSDNPVCSVTPGDHSPYSGGWGSSGVEITFPLTSKLGLLCSWKKGASFRVAEASVEQIRTMNLRTINQASDLRIISFSKNFPASELVNM